MYYNYGGLYYCPPNMDNTPNASMDYWARSLFQRLTALIEFEGLPEAAPGQYGWDKDALKFGLFMLGFQVIFKSKTYGVVPQPGTVTGFGLQYQPSGAMVNTPYFQFNEPIKIGVDCELLKLTPDYYGVYDIVTKYAAELKEIDTSIRSAARNSRFGFVFAGKDQKTALTLKGIKERIINGQDAFIDDKILKENKADPGEPPWFAFDRDLGKNYILGNLLDDRRKTLVDFYREIGVRMLDDKKERMNLAEVDAGNAETFIRSEVWIETLKTSCEKVNKMFGTNIKPVINRPDVAQGSEDSEEVSDNVR